MIDYAVVHGYAGDVDRNRPNPARWKGNLEHALPHKTDVAKVEHHASLPYAKIAAFLADLRQRPGVGSLALELLILTAARSGEVRGATFGEFDLKARVWTVPKERMKAGREHRVPLTGRAVEIVAELAKGAKPDDLVFPGQGGKPMSDMTLTAVLRRMGRGDVTAHGFRSTFRDWCAEATSYPRELGEAALAHAVGDKVEAAYLRGSLFEKRRALMQTWADFCAGEACADGQGPSAR